MPSSGKFVEYVVEVELFDRGPGDVGESAAGRSQQTRQIHPADAVLSELPYAKRRAVAIARAVATAPSVLLFDEPAAGLDEHSTKELATLVRRLGVERRTGDDVGHRTAPTSHVRDGVAQCASMVARWGTATRGGLRSGHPLGGGHVARVAAHTRCRGADLTATTFGYRRASRSEQKAAVPLTSACGASHGTKCPQFRSRNGPTWRVKTCAAI
jgi:hypothetical protein